MDFTTLRYTPDEGIGRITFSRPGLYNRLDIAAHEELERALVAAQTNPALRVLVINGEGKHFSAGGDLSEFEALREDPVRRRRMFVAARHLVHRLTTTEIPVIAVVQGEAAGLGASIAVLCDILVVAKTSGLTDPHVGIGLAAGDGGCVGWPLAMGLNRAKRYLLTGERLSGERAYQFGLATDLVEDADGLAATAEAIAQRIRGLAPEAVRGTKRALASYTRRAMADAFEVGLMAEEQDMSRADSAEAVRAITEKRHPVFTGR
jgi:enoyl-CoA hydratase